MDCLTGYIGLRGTGYDTPISGLYLNDLPSITLAAIDKSSNSDSKTFFETFERVEKRAIMRLVSDISTAFSQQYRLKTVAQSNDLGKIIGTATQAPAAELRGVSIEQRLASYYRQSSLSSVSIQTVSLYLTTTTTTAIKIYNEETNELLDTFPVNGVAGWNLIPINKRYDALRLFVCYDASNVTTTEMRIQQSSVTAFSSMVSWLWGLSGQALVRGAKSTNVNDARHLSYANDFHGLSMVFSLVCKWDNLICNNREAFAQALWYLMGAEMMVERLASDRFNYITLDRDQANANMTHFIGQYNALLTNCIKGIELDTSDTCIICNAPVQIAESRM
jgi:hypothetical protein